MDSVYLLRAPVARDYQVWLQGGLSGNPPSSIDIGSGLPPPLRCIQVEELPAPVEVSLGMAESLALAPLPATPAASAGPGALCTPAKGPAVVENVAVAVAPPATAAAAAAAPRKRRRAPLVG